MFLRTGGGLQLFELEFQLLDLAEDLLALRSEEQALELLHQEHKPFDLATPRGQSLGIVGMLSKYERLLRRMIQSVPIGQREGINHARSVPRTWVQQVNKRAWILSETLTHSTQVERSEAVFASQSFQQHRQLRRAQRDRSAPRLRPHESSSFQPVRQQTPAAAIEP